MLNNCLLCCSVLLTLLATGQAAAGALKRGSNALPTKKWWEHANVYQIYPRSFADSDGDGIGDLPGITSRLQHLADIGIDTIWMSPLFESPQKDFGYDVSDFYRIHHEYGTMADFEAFVKRAAELGIGVMLDFVPNHTSSEMEWFKKSENRDGKYSEYYVWHNGTRDKAGKLQPPNNWGSVFGGSGWTWSEKREQYYFHQFYREQPDLNYRNADVVEDMYKVLDFWLTKNIVGFRVDAFNHMFENASFPDEPVSGNTNDINSYEYLSHIHTKDQQETFEMIYNWRQYFDEFARKNNVSDKILMVEVYASIEDTMRYYRAPNGTIGSHMPFNFQLIYVGQPLTAVNVKQNIDHWLNYMPPGHTPNWVTGSHDHSRVATRLGTNVIDAMNTISLLLPGTSVTYYGEEIGMIDNAKQPIVVDHRDPYRTPMQWNNSVSGGYSSSNTTWLLVNENYRTVNVDVQRTANRSHYHHYRELTTLRNEPTFELGDLKSKVLARQVLAFTREYPGLPTYVVLVNLGAQTHQINLTQSFFALSANLTVVSSAASSPYRNGTRIESGKLVLHPFDALVMRSSGSGTKAFSFVVCIMAILMQVLW